MSFVDFARAHGVVIDRLEVGRLRRCATSGHPRRRNGAYRFDGRRGWCMAWDGDGLVHWYGETGTWTPADERAWKARQDAERARTTAGWHRAAQRAADLMAQARLGPHGYLRFKGLGETPALGLPDESLLVPMRDVRTNALMGAQLIKWDMQARRWGKKMLPGMRAKGAVWRSGPRHAAMTVLCEGYATGLSIEAAVRHMRLSAAVLVCFSDHNLVHVAPVVVGMAVVFADNDASGAGVRAARATGLPYCMAPREGWDANDWHAECGIYPVAQALMDVRRETVAA